jgi:hypothetical protein
MIIVIIIIMPCHVWLLVFPTISSITMFVPMFFSDAHPHLCIFGGIFQDWWERVPVEFHEKSLYNPLWNPYEILMKSLWIPMKSLWTPIKVHIFFYDILWPLIVWKSSKSSPRTLSAAHSSVKPHRSPRPQGLGGADGAVPWVNSWWVHQP